MFDPDKIKLKYILGTYKDGPGYPIGEDIMYYIIKRHYERDASDEITFTDNFAIKKIGTEYMETILKSLDGLVSSGYLEITRETKDSTSYRVLINEYTNAV